MRVGVVLLCVLVLAGCDGSEAMKVPEPTGAQTIQVTSSAFSDGEQVPRAYTCQGDGGSPPLAWQGVPAGAASLALVVSDPDAPSGTFVHWVLYDVQASDGAVPAGGVPPGAREADNSAGKRGWYPPCPPSGTHHYRFTVYALGSPLTASGTQALLEEIGDVAVAQGTLTGLVRAR